MYKKLPFEQYYIDTSKDWRDTGKARLKINYKHISFTYNLFNFIPIKCSAEYEIHYEENRNVIQIHFEQTHGFKDWVINFLFMKKMYDKFQWTNPENNKTYTIQLKACRGWAEMFKTIKKDLEEEVSKLLEAHPDAYIEIIGWSLGSSQAQFACQDINWKFGKLPYVYTFGSVKPWIGGRKQRKYLNHTFKECYNFMHGSDIVTYMPPFIGYFALNPIKLGNVSLRGLFNPQKWHTEYGEKYLYEED